MSKNQSLRETETNQFIEAFKKVKRFRLFEPSVGVLGFIFVTCCVVCSFFYLDYRPVVIGKVYSSRGKAERFVWLKVNNNGSNNGSETVEFLTKDGDGCDVFDGEWVWDERYPLYQSKDCIFVDDGFRCSENGRPDLFYTKWRWQPKHCNLPRFDAKLMLEKLRNKRLVFAGDSIGRNQWESVLCMLSSAVPDKKSIYEVNGSPISKHKGYLVFKFEDYNCTIEYYRAPFLVLQHRPPPGAPDKAKLTIRVDQMDWSWNKWKHADVLVLNTGHWWNNEKTIRWGTYFQEGEDVKLEMTVEHAYRRSMETVVQKIQNEVDMSKTQVFFRTFAPVHFRGGDWKTGGNCHLETLPDLGPSLSLIPSETWPRFKLVVDILTSYPPHIRKFDILNVTGMTSRRKDGHSSLYYLTPEPAPLHRQDCSHWCLPGVPDSWNELLYAVLLKREATRTLYRAQV